MTDEKTSIEQDIEAYHKAVTSFFEQLCGYNICESHPASEAEFMNIFRIENDLADKYDLDVFKPRIPSMNEFVEAALEDRSVPDDTHGKSIASLAQTRIMDHNGVIGFEYYGAYMRFLTVLLNIRDKDKSND